MLERRRSLVIRAATKSRRKVVSARLGLVIRRLETVKPAVNGYLFESGKNKAVKGEGWAPSFICSAKDIVGP